MRLARYNVPVWDVLGGSQEGLYSLLMRGETMTEGNAVELKGVNPALMMGGDFDQESLKDKKDASKNVGLGQKLGLSPNEAAFFDQAVACFEEGKWEDAEKLVSDISQIEAVLLMRARCRARQGEYVESQKFYTALLKLAPTNYSGWLEAGNVCRHQGFTDQAALSYRKAIDHAPSRYEARLSLARLLEEAGRNDEAAREYHWAIIFAGRDRARSVHWRMAKFRIERGDMPRALEAMRQALLVSRLDQSVDINEKAEMQISIGEIFYRVGLEREAEAAFERASHGTSEDVLTRLAETMFRFNYWEQAQEVLKRNLKLHPNSAQGHWNLAHAYAESWLMDDAMAELEKAEKIAEQPGAESMRAKVAAQIGHIEEALSRYSDLANKEGKESAYRSSAAMSSLYSDKLSAEEVTELHRAMCAPMCENPRSASSFKNERNAGRRLRLGILSGDFHHQHPVNIFMQPVLARLNKKAFEVFVYATGSIADEQTRLAKSRVDHWTEVSLWNDDKLALRIEEDAIDIVLDLSGHTGGNRLLMLGRRVAPVQMTFLGYPGTTGSTTIDWLIADPRVAPEGSDHLFTERVTRLPNTVFCFAPEENYPYPEYGPECATRQLTFGSFNNVPKLTPHTVQLWSKILKAVPESRLLLKAPSFGSQMAIRAFTDRFSAEGIGPDRLVFRPPCGLNDMMAEYADVDIALDPVPYNGGTTTMQALWMGVPVIVKEGGAFVSRMGSSFMSAAGLQDWVATNDEEYVQIAQAVSRNRDELLALKRGLRDRLKRQPAWDPDQYTNDFQGVLREAWIDFVNGAGRG